MKKFLTDLCIFGRVSCMLGHAGMILVWWPINSIPCEYVRRLSAGCIVQHLIKIVELAKKLDFKDPDDIEGTLKFILKKVES